MKADRYLKTGKKLTEQIKMRKMGRVWRTAAAVLALTLAFFRSRSAADGSRRETWYYLDDDGVRQTGWVQTEKRQVV